MAYLDERLGELFDGLQRVVVLDQTLVIVTADHGEGMGDHDLFDHGESLYRNEVRVPLLIVLPAPATSPKGKGSWATRSAFAICRRQSSNWSGSARRSTVLGPVARRACGVIASSRPAADATEGSLSPELPLPNPMNPNQGCLPLLIEDRFPALADGDFVYIRNEGDGTEEFFNDRDDPGERAILPMTQRL